MVSKSQLNATRTHRRRATARGLVRVEVEALKKDVALIRMLAETLRGEADKAEALRAALARALRHRETRTAFEVFGSELPDQAFEGVFDQRRQQDSRELDL
jgi:PBP1b-binding outer membrane lipoprotein LpoB